MSTAQRTTAQDKRRTRPGLWFPYQRRLLGHRSPEPLEAAKPTAGRRRWPWLVLAVLAGYAAFCHGCHGDEDTELLADGVSEVRSVHPGP
jgi:hypothetical protein